MIEYYRKNVVPQYQKIIEERERLNNLENNKDLFLALCRWSKKQEMSLQERRQLNTEFNTCQNPIVKDKIRKDLRKVNDRLRRIESRIKDIVEQINKEKQK